MQIRARHFSRLRQKLVNLKDLPRQLLIPFLDDQPVVKGTLYPLRRKCAKRTCRCARGQLHETMVLSASVSGKTRLWTIPEDRIEEIREMTERYRHFCRARADFVEFHGQRLTEMLRIIDALKRIRKKEP